MSRKRSNSSAPPKASPALKRRRAESDAGFEQTAQRARLTSNEADGQADVGSDVELVTRKKDDLIVDEDGSFFHATPTQVTGETETCIKFVDILPSEMITSNTKTPRRVTRSSQKAAQVVSNHTSKDGQKPKQQSNSKPKPQPNPKKKTPSKPETKPKPKSQPRSKSGTATAQQADSKPRPKLTLKLSTSSLVASARIEPLNSFADEYEEPEDYEEDDGDKEIDSNDVDVDASHVTFAIERDGAHEIVRLPVTISYDLFRFHMSETIQSIPNDMKLTYKCPGVKKSELGVHLLYATELNVVTGLRTPKAAPTSTNDDLNVSAKSRQGLSNKVWQLTGALSSAKHFERLRDKINSDLKKLLTKVKTASKGAGKRATDQRAKAVDDFKSYTITICDLAQQKLSTGGKQSGGGGSKLSTKEDSNTTHRRYLEYLKSNRPKCTTCQDSCGIVPLRGQGPTHVPLTEECLDLWAKLSALKKASPYSLTPPQQVLEMLRVTTEAKSRSKPVSSASSSTNSDQQLIVASNRGSVQKNFQPANPPSGNLGIPSMSSTGPSSFSTTPASVSLGAPQMALNGGMFMGGSGVGLGTGFGLPAHMSQFASGMNQPSLVMYNAPQGMGLGMAAQSIVSGFPGVQLGSIGGFPIISLGGMFGGMSENGANMQG